MLPAMVIIIESGALYSTCLIILLATYIAKSYLQYIALAAVSVIRCEQTEVHRLITINHNN